MHAGNILPAAVSMDLGSGKDINVRPYPVNIWHHVFLKLWFFCRFLWKVVFCYLIEFVELPHSLHCRVIPATISFQDLKTATLVFCAQLKLYDSWWRPTSFWVQCDDLPSSSWVQSLNDCRHISEDARIHQSWKIQVTRVL